MDTNYKETEPYRMKVKQKTIKEGVEGEMGVKKALVCLISIFLLSSCALAYVYMNFPHLEEKEYEHMKLPSHIEDAKNIGRVLSRLQTFAIPGSIFLSILSGFLFRWEVALFLICVCSATGATFCYLLFYLVGRPLVTKYFPTRIKLWQEKIDKHKDNLLFYVIFLRITPFLPNWFINISSPVLNVSLRPFWLGTLIG
ncbi:Transmembrane protein 41B, partial [Armadillidium nasatum]